MLTGHTAKKIRLGTSLVKPSLSPRAVAQTDSSIALKRIMNQAIALAHNLKAHHAGYESEQNESAHEG